MSKIPPPIDTQLDGTVAFFDTPGLDAVYRTCLALAEQLAIVRDRLDTVERILEAKGSLTQADLDAFEPTQSDEKEKQALMSDLVSEVLAPVESTLTHFEAGELNNKKGEAP